MWHQADQYDRSPLRKLTGKRPERLDPAWKRRNLRENFIDLVWLALEQAEKVREGQSRLDIFPVSACIVFVQHKSYGIEFNFGRASAFVGGFADYHEARRWVVDSSAELLRNHGIPEGTNINIVGVKYY